MSIYSAERERNEIPSQEGFESFKGPLSNLIYKHPLVDDHGRYWGTSLLKAFIGPLYTFNIDRLRTAGKHLSQEVYGISERQAEEEIFQNMRTGKGLVLLASAPKFNTHEGSSIDRVLALPGMLVTQVAERFHIGSAKSIKDSIDGLIAFAAVQQWKLPTDDGVLNVMYIGEIAVLSQYRSMGLGADLFRLANMVYKPDKIILRGRSGRIIRSLIRSKLVSPNGIVPFCESWNEDPVNEKLLDLAGKRTVHPNPIDPVTGITKAVYAEGADRAYTADSRRKESYEWDVAMWEKGLDPDNGDAMHLESDVVGKIRARFAAKAFEAEELTDEVA